MTTPAVEVRLGSDFGNLLNISATGALMRIHAEVPVGRECVLILNLPDGPVSSTVRVMRARSTSAGLPPGTDHEQECLVGVKFTELSSKTLHAIVALCGTAFNERE